MVRPQRTVPSPGALRMRRARAVAAGQVARPQLPWRWLSKLQFERLAGQAYLVATHEAARAVLEDTRLDQGQLDAVFSDELENALQALLMEAATQAGNVDTGVVCRAFNPEGIADVRRRLQEAQEAAWRPQYPLYLPTAAELDARSEDLQ